MDCQKFLDKLEKDNGFIKKTGIEYGECSDGYATGRVKLDESNLNPYGEANGGCIFTLADTIGGIAATTRGYYVCTLSSSIDFLHAGRETKYLYAKATEVKNGKNVSVYDIMITDDKDIKIARATISYYKLGPMEP